MRSTTDHARRYVLAAVVLLACLTALGLYAWQTDQARWEIGVLTWLQQDSPPGLRSISMLLSIAGAGLPWAVLIGLFSLGLLTFAGVRVALLLLLTALLQDVGAGLKLLVERSRPVEGSVEVWRQIGSYSFPSGHTLGATLVFGFLMVAVERCALRTWVKRLLQAGCLVWIAMMGIARMEVGAHWPTDVLGAYLLGALLLIPIVAMLPRPQAAAAASQV